MFSSVYEYVAWARGNTSRDHSCTRPIRDCLFCICCSSITTFFYQRQPAEADDAVIVHFFRRQFFPQKVSKPLRGWVVDQITIFFFAAVVPVRDSTLRTLELDQPFCGLHPRFFGPNLLGNSVESFSHFLVSVFLAMVRES